MPRTVEEFVAAAAARGITRWPTRRCGFCHYPMAYLIEGDAVLYDSACWCLLPTHPRYREVPEVRSFEDLAEFYNIQTSPAVIAEMDRFWGFDAS